MPARRRADIRAFRNAGAVRRPLGVPDHLVGEEGEAVTDSGDVASREDDHSHGRDSRPEAVNAALE